MVALLVLTTAAAVVDVADQPSAADEGPRLETGTVVSASPTAAMSTTDSVPSSGTATPVVTHVLAAAFAEHSGVASGVVLRVDTSGADDVRTDGAHPVVDAPELAELEPVFDRWADHFGVPDDLLKALAWVESGWNNDTRSAGGGIGIGRLQPQRAQYLAEHVAGMALDPTVAMDNIALTAAQLRVLLDETPDVASAVAAHRQGITDTRLSGVDPLLDGYVEAVLTMRLRFA